MNESNLPAGPAASVAPPGGRKPRVVVVLGMHRSGTSLLANLLTTLGVDLGEDLLAADTNNQAGYWEHQAINHVQDSFLHKLSRRWGGQAWTNPFPLDWEQVPESERCQVVEELSAIVREEMSRAKGIWGFKDPRTSRLWPMWKEIFAGLGVEPMCLLALRDPGSVAESLAKRDQMPAAHAEMLWMLHNLDAVRDAGDQLRLVVDYERWFSCPEEQAHAVAEALELPWPAAAEQLVADLRQRIRPDLRHCEGHQPPTLPFIQEVHGALKRAAETGRTPAELGRLDAEIRRALALCQPWIGPAKLWAAPTAKLEEAGATPASTPGEARATPSQAEFDESRYLSLYGDVADAVRDGICASGWHHFLSSGSSEGRRWFRLHSPGQAAAVRKSTPSSQGGGREGLEHLQKNWDLLGKVDPMWAILSVPEKKNNGWDRDEFFKSGEPVIRQNVAHARRLQPAMGFARALDFGCGVGRLTQALCLEFERGDGVDIAPSMIEQAKGYNRHADRCHYHLNSKDDLRQFPDESFDFISSFIVLQHIRPEFSRRYIREFVRLLGPNGVLVFQLPGDQNKLLTGERNGGSVAQPETLIEMHGLAKSEVVQLLEGAGARILEVRPDGLAGPDAESYTYFVTKDSKLAATRPAIPAAAPAAALIPARPGGGDGAFCTIVSKNYLSQARTFALSVRQQHPDAKIFVLLVDKIEGCFDPAKEPFETVLVEELKRIPNTPHLFFKYDVMELNTAVKPYFLRHLFEERGFKKVLYFDPDILVLDRVDHMWSLLEKHMMLLTPHITEPYEDGLHPNEIEINQSGIFNLGFIGLSDQPDLKRFLTWWEQRLYDFCASDVARGLFTDQRWMNFAPVMYDGVHVLKELTHNIAYWNLNTRAARMRCVNDRWFLGEEPVVFFHFSGFDAKNIEPVSKHQNRFCLADLPNLRPLFAYYRDQLFANGQKETGAWRYAFDFFRNGVRIPPFARKIYRETGVNHFFGDPYETEAFGSFYKWLNEDFSLDDTKEPAPISNLLVHIYSARPDLKLAFPDVVGKNAKAWKEWLHAGGCKDFKLDPVFLPPLGETGARSGASASSARKSGRSSLPFGVNVAGFFTGEFGNGETARANIRALQVAEIPHVLNNVSYALHSQNDRQVTDFSADNPYAVNLIHVNADTTPAFRLIAGRKYFEGRHNIGLWWWELERFPDAWKPHFEKYQEIWTQSTFCQKSIARISPVPVTLIPHVVHVDEKSLKPGVRERLEIPRDNFVFLFSFDYLSYMERKNPLAVIESFRQAFGMRRDALLVMKSVNGHLVPAGQKRIEAATAGLNVRFVTDHLSRPEMLSLIAESDCYVSLHRSEGFGQGMAEAMFLGKPVIATNYSGNTDFMTMENSFPVRYRLVELERNYGPYEKGNQWADADIEHAAEQMQLVVGDRSLAAHRAQRAAQDIRAKHSQTVVAQLMARRLQQITGVKDIPQASTSVTSSKSAPAPQISSGPRVSIIIPTFNKLELTQKCLEKIAANTPAGLCEVIVVDNGSTDGTAAFLQEQNRKGVLKPVLNSANLGFSRACNLGAKAARGEYLLFLNNDTEPQPGWLEPLLAILDTDASVASVGSKLLYPDGTIQHAGVALAELAGKDPLVAIHMFAHEKADHAAANQRRICQALTAACLLTRKSAFGDIGGFDEEFWNGYEDVDLCLRLQEKGQLNVYEPASVVIHHESKSGPERFRCVQQNVERLHHKWLDKAQPDVLIDAAGRSRLAPAPRLKPYAGPVKMAASIIILAHNQLEHTRYCLESIRAHTPLPHELILVDNASTDGTAEYFRLLAGQQSNVVVITNRKNLGFAGGNNQGLAAAKGECVVLLNNDTVVTKGWLEKMLAALQRHPEAGIVGPMSNYVAGPQLVRDVPYKNLEEMPAFAAEWSRAHAGQAQEISRVVGFCLLARRSVMERIGGLDEQFGSGNFEDDDFCLRAGFAGFRVCIAQDVFVHHTGSRTFIGAKIDYRESMLRNWKLFKAKWGMAPDAKIEDGYRVPASLPSTAPLMVLLPEPGQSQSGTATTARAAILKRKANSAPLVLPPCALVGQVTGARELLKKKQLEAAWNSAVAALQSRPFHPEAGLLLAEIAQAAGNSVAARHCAQHARNLAPDWKPARQFLKGNLRGNQKPAWLTLPAAVANPSKTGGRLSVCLIAKNEEKFLGQCLASVRELAAQIVVVDTGSNDRTVEIAKQAGAEVHEFAWNDDFSAARNEALKFATGDWVLFLDADEELLPAHRETILQEMQAASVMAWRLPIIDQGREKEGCSHVPRLFRNAPGLFYVGRVHEQVFTSIEVRRQEWGLENRLGKSALLHHGYTNEMVVGRDKIGRNLRLLERAIEEMPDEPNLLMSLGLELARSGRLNEGLDRYEEALQLMSALPTAQVVPELRETLLTQYATQLLAAKRFTEIVQLWRTPFARSTPMTASQHFVLGLAELELKEPAEAGENMRQCIAKRNLPALSPINPEILKAGPNHCLALALAALKKNEEAAAAFKAAFADEPKSRAVKFDFARFQFERGEALEALKLLNELVGDNADDAQVWQFGGQIALSRPDFFGFARDWTGEAHAHFPQHPVITAQRAEALMLGQDTDAALPLWTAAHSPKSARHLAALVICEAIAGNSERRFSPEQEPLVSQELLKWYQLLLAARANGLVTRLNEKMEILRAVTPSFVKVWETAVAEARGVATAV